MSLETIRQNIQSMVELSDKYDKLVRERKYSIEKGKDVKNIDKQISDLKNLILKIMNSVNKSVKSEVSQ